MAGLGRKLMNPEISVEQLFEQIGRLQMELEWVKKNLPSSLEPSENDRSRRLWISIRRQCELLGIPRVLHITNLHQNQKRTF